MAIRFERDGAVGNIVLANPPFNRLDLRFAEALRMAVHQASESDIRVLVVRSEGPHFSFGGEVREWPGKDVNWFRTFVAKVNASYRAIEMLKIPTVAVVRGIAFGGGFELALACDFLVAAENATFRCVEVTTAMLPLAGALQRIAERAGRARASRFAMLGEPISGTEAGKLGIATHVAPEDQLSSVAAALTHQLATIHSAYATSNAAQSGLCLDQSDLGPLSGRLWRQIRRRTDKILTSMVPLPPDCRHRLRQHGKSTSLEQIGCPAGD